MGKLFLLCTRLARYETMMQEIPGFKDKYIFDYRYYGLLEDTFGENSAEKLYKKIIEINGGDVYRMLFTDDRHKSRFNNFYKFAVKNGYEIIESNKNIAAIFLLSANEYLWEQAKSVIADNELMTDKIDTHSDDEDVYDIYQAIRFILYGSDRLSIEDLAEPEIMKDSVVMLITNAFIVNKYGIEVLKNSNNIKKKNGGRRNVRCYTQ